jgi:hypothetical protein
MLNVDMKKEILDQLAGLGPDQQQKVLDFARALAVKRPIGTPGRDLLRFAGMIQSDDLDAMTQAIEEGCEQVDADEW